MKVSCTLSPLLQRFSGLSNETRLLCDERPYENSTCVFTYEISTSGIWTFSHACGNSTCELLISYVISLRILWNINTCYLCSIIYSSYVNCFFSHINKRFIYGITVPHNMNFHVHIWTLWTLSFRMWNFIFTCDISCEIFVRAGALGHWTLECISKKFYNWLNWQNFSYLL